MEGLYFIYLNDFNLVFVGGKLKIVILLECLLDVFLNLNIMNIVCYL